MERRHTVGTSNGLDMTHDRARSSTGGKKKRIRKAYSCGNCRHRKIKCERTFPCQQCQLRGIASSCGGTSLYKEYVQADERRKQSLKKAEEAQQVPFRSNLMQPPPQPLSQESPVTTTTATSSNTFSPPEGSIPGPSSSSNPSSLSVSAGSLWKTMDLFQNHITRIEHRIQSAHAPSSSSSSSQAALAKGSRRRHVTSSVSFNDSRTTLDIISRHVKKLERKVDMIIAKLDEIAGPFPPPEVEMTERGNTTFTQAQVDPSPMIGLSSSAPNPISMPDQMNTNSGLPMDFDENVDLEIAIDRWLQREGLGSSGESHLGSSHLDPQYNLAAQSQSAPTISGPHMNDYFSL